MNQKVTDLEQMLDRMDEAASENKRVALKNVLEHVGQRSFSPILLLAGLITVAPVIGDFPGVPTSMGLLVAIISVQMLLHKKHMWLPQWLLNRSISQSKLSKGIEWMRPPARFIDRFLRPRLTQLTHRTGGYAIAVACLLIAAAMPVMEIVPFSANLAGAALTAFGLALIAHDGAVALLAFSFTLVTFGVVIHGLI